MRGDLFSPSLCKPDIIYVLNRADGLHFFEVSSMPTLNWYNPFGSFIDKPEQMKTVADFPLVIIDLLESKRLSSEDLGDVNEIAVPLDLAVVSHLPNDHCRVIFHGRDLAGIATWRGR